MRATKPSHDATVMPSWRFTASGSKALRCGTLIAPLALPNAICRVLLHTTRTLVNCAVVASVPSQAVARSR